MTKKKKIIIFALAAILLFFLWFLYWFFFTDRTTKIKETEQITPTAIPAPPEEKGKGNSNLYEKLQIETQNEYPLLNLTPHRENTWVLDYTGPLRLETTIKGPVTDEIKNEVLTWIKNQGVDPATHQINWTGSR